MIRLYTRNLQKTFRPDRAFVKKIFDTVISEENADASGQVCVCFVTDERIRLLNSRYHSTDSPTDVLSFPLGQKAGDITADIFVSADTALRQSRIYKTDPEYELYLYVVHGLLHLLGYDDIRSKDARMMRRKEKEYLRKLKIVPR